MHEKKLEYPPIPADDPKRTLKLAAPDKEDGKLPHIGLVGDTYTITVSGDDTNDRFCVIDMQSRRAVVPVRIAMTSKRRLSCSTVRSR